MKFVFLREPKFLIRVRISLVVVWERTQNHAQLSTNFLSILSWEGNSKETFLKFFDIYDICYLSNVRGRKWNKEWWWEKNISNWDNSQFWSSSSWIPPCLAIRSISSVMCPGTSLKSSLAICLASSALGSFKWMNFDSVLESAKSVLRISYSE